MFRKLKKSKQLLIITFIIELFVLIIAYGAIIAFKGAYNIEVSTYIVYSLISIVLLFNLIILSRYLKKVEKFFDRTDITISSIFGNEVSPVFEFSKTLILVYDEEDEIIWVSQTSILDKKELLGKKVYELISNVDEIISKEVEQDMFVSLFSKDFLIEINNSLRTIYLKDVTNELIQTKNYMDNELFIGHINIDNYQDISTRLNESQFDEYVSEIKEEIFAYAKKYNLFIRLYNVDSFLIIGEEKNYIKMKNDGFMILEQIKEKSKESDNPLTISIGIGKGNTPSFLRKSETAYMALNMALTRGGNQVVINTFGKPLEYFGAKDEIKQSRSHVRGRTLASSLSSLIVSSSKVLIMGHKHADFDSLGASIGIHAICKSLGVESKFVYEKELFEYQTNRAFLENFLEDEIDNITISATNALKYVDEDTVVVIVDTHRKDSLLQPKALDNCKEICLIDHHRRGDDFISDLSFSYHEPQASSASELVTELIYFQDNKVALDKNTANFLLAGIMLDTKFFKSSTSSKTFEMAMYLKSFDADESLVSDFFNEEYESIKMISSIINCAYVITPGIIISTAEDDEIITRSILSKAADELLSTKETKAVFVIGKTAKNQISISARSDDTYNVQIIMEKMGGGGHFSQAACQIFDSNLNDVEETLKNIIKDVE